MNYDLCLFIFSGREYRRKCHNGMFSGKMNKSILSGVSPNNSSDVQNKLDGNAFLGL